MKKYIYYLATTLNAADGRQQRHYFIDTNKRAMQQLKNKLGGLDAHIDTIWRDTPGGKASRQQITTHPFPVISDPKNLICWR